MEDWCGGRPDSRSGWSDKRGAAKSWEDTHRETTAAAVSSLINLKQTWAKERRDAKSWRQRIPAEKSRIRWLIVRSKLLVSRRIKIEYIKPVWLFVARSFKTWAKSFHVWILSNARCKQNESQDERLPRKFPQGTRPGTRLWHFPNY